MKVYTGKELRKMSDDLKEMNEGIEGDFLNRRFVPTDNLNEWIDKRVSEMSKEYSGSFTNHGEIPRELQREIKP